jgi:hypothetical protein
MRAGSMRERLSRYDDGRREGALDDDDAQDRL